MAKILCIETSASALSVCLAEDGRILADRVCEEPRQQAALTAPLVKEVLDAAGVAVKDCDAVCVSAGPGSYTGLRVGASTAKGGFRKIRIRANSADLKALLPKALLIGSADLLNDSHWNKGEMFEKIITEMFTADKWVKDSVPFFLAGDAVIGGENVQIKLNGAELTNEKILTRYGFLG